MTRLEWEPLTIRLRLGLALALALLPVLLLGLAQSVVGFRHDAFERRASLLAGAERSALVARNRVQNAIGLLDRLTPQREGLQCAPGLFSLIAHAQGYANIVRLDHLGRVACAADSVGYDPGRRESDWFMRLRRGDHMVVTGAPPGAYAREPAILGAVRAETADGQFDGALVAVTGLAGLKPDRMDPFFPPGTEVALLDPQGRYLIRTRTTAFPPESSTPVRQAAGGQSRFFYGRDGRGAQRVFATAPLIGPDVQLLLSAPSPGLFSWAQLNLLSSVLLPLLTFCVALLAVWVVAERVVVRWLHYLERIAAIYARGRFTVRPVRAESAPPEIRQLAHTVHAMADTIVARDRSLNDSLAQKDTLMREIHHRVKNNLQVITSLLNMQQRALTDPAARSAMSDTRQRIGALALIYRALYQGPDLRRVDLRQFLEELLAQLMAGEAPRTGAIRTEFEADELIVDPDKLAPLALFAVEAIGNAQKHAFGDRGGLLRVRFTVRGDEASLEISDDGSGNAPALVTEGVGRTLMTAFARQLRGQVEIGPNALGGVTARLTFPAPQLGPPKIVAQANDGNQSAA